MLIAALDAAYGEQHVAGACVLFDHIGADKPVSVTTTLLEAPFVTYRTGELYRRELPVLLDLLSRCMPFPDLVIVDGYAFVSQDDQLGLGARLHHALASRRPVIGVAKNQIKADIWSIPILRGTSRTPLQVTSCGIHKVEAGRLIAQLHGPHRLPTMLKLADAKARETLAVHTAQAKAGMRP